MSTGEASTAGAPWRRWLLRLSPRSAAALAALAAAPLAAGLAAVVLTLAHVPLVHWPWPLAGAALPAVLAAPSAARVLLRLLHDLEDAQAEAERLALTDPLTGAHSRRQFYLFTEAELARSRRAQVPLSVLVIDVDGLRRINDHQGHDAGDEALQAVAAACRRDLRDYDTLARHGGDSFAVLLPQTGTDTAVTIGERVRTAVAALPPVSVTVGVATALPGSDLSVDALMALAEEALARAQQAGGNRVLT